MITITRRIEFDAGHRIPDHASKCRNMHGHRYVLEATIEGNVKPADGSSSGGMVIDFGDLKMVMTATIGERWDHAFLVFDEDEPAIRALQMLGRDHRTIELPCIPTVENLAQLAFDSLAHALSIAPELKLVHVRLYETPNCWADVRYVPTKGRRLYRPDEVRDTLENMTGQT